MKCENCVHLPHYGCENCKNCPDFENDADKLKAAKIHGIKAFYDNAIDGTFAKMERDGLDMDYLKGRMAELCGIVTELAIGD